MQWFINVLRNHMIKAMAEMLISISQYYLLPLLALFCVLSVAVCFYFVC